MVPLNRAQVFASMMIGPPNFVPAPMAPTQNRLPRSPEAAYGRHGLERLVTNCRSCFQTGETTMTTYDHIQELRGELAASVDPAERATIEAELMAARAKLAEEEAAL